MLWQHGAQRARRSAGVRCPCSAEDTPRFPHQCEDDLLPPVTSSQSVLIWRVSDLKTCRTELTCVDIPVCLCVFSRRIRCGGTGRVLLYLHRDRHVFPGLEEPKLVSVYESARL